MTAIVVLIVLLVLPLAATLRSADSDADRPVTGMQWLALTVLRVAAALRRFNADQIELRERWLRRHGVAARESGQR